MRLLCSSVLRPGRARLNHESLLGRVHSVRRDDFKAKSRRRKDTTQPSRHPILTTKDTKSTKKNHPYGQEPLCSAISQIRSLLRKLFHHDGRKGHEVLKKTMPVRGTKRRILLMEAMTQPDHSAFLRICVPALRPCRMGPAEAPIKVDQTKSNRIKPARGRNWPKLDSAVAKETAEHRMVKPPTNRVEAQVLFQESGPLCGLSRPTVSSQTQSNQIYPVSAGSVSRNWTRRRRKRPGGLQAGQTQSNQGGLGDYD
jgi:hypothetical protein